MDAPHIRRAISEDVPAIEACARAAYAIYVERIGREPAPMVADFARQVINGQIWILAQHTNLLGFVVFYPRDDHLHLENLAMVPAIKGRGLGRRLLEFVEDEARRRSLAAVELYTHEKMIENQVFYPRCGYREIDRRIEDGFDRVYYRKDVS